MKDAISAAFARKYRPQGWGEMVGQEAVTVTLKNAIAAGAPGHAYLFFGPRGIGKTTAARILAKALNCAKGPSAEPCGRCVPCSEIAAGSAIDVLELDAATHTQVEKIREMILETVALAPSRDRYKVFIIDEVHMLSTSSFNALLKTLEEPPAHVVFILATTEPAKIPATIISRCQRFRFRPLSVETLAAHLRRLAGQERIKAEDQALELLARAAGGSLRDAVSLLEQAQAYAAKGSLGVSEVTELLGMLPEEALLAVAGAILAKDAQALRERIEGILEEGYDAGQLLRDLRERLHGCYLQALGVSVELEPPWKSLAGKHGAQAFYFLVGRMNEALERLRQEESPRLALEQSLYGALEAAYDLGEWVRRLEALEKRLQGAPPRQQREQPEPLLPEPVPVAEGGAAQQTWADLLRQLREEKPGLASALESARLDAAAQAEWRLLFAPSMGFQLEQARRGQSLVEAKLATKLGRPLKLRLETAAGLSAEPPGLSEEPEESPAPAADPALQKVLEVFPGRLRPAKKKA